MMGANPPRRLPVVRVSLLAWTLLCLGALVAGAVEIPVDAADLPLWQIANWDDFPVELNLADPAALDALLAAVPLADFHREQLRPAGGGLRLRIRVTESEYRALELAGYLPRRLPDSERDVRETMEARWAEQAARGGEVFSRGERGIYHTHAQLAQILLDAQTDHPAIAQRGSIGQSVQGRELWTLIISANVGIEEAEPEVRISASMHGNEKIAMEMSVYLIEYLTDNYGQPGYEDVTNLVDNYEIHFLPLHNPDGHVANSRYNANGVDLNRNYPVPDGSIGEDGTYTEQVETVAMKNWGFGQNFVVSQDGHSGALVVNYPWDYTYTLAPDNDAFIVLSEEYSWYNQPMWNGWFYHGITNGAQWYVTKGSLQDWSYHETGSLHVIVEFSDNYAPPAGQLDGYWDDNRESFMHWIKASRYGVNGVVTDAATGLPLAATVTVIGIDKPVFTDPDFGDYYKLLDSGSYTLRFEATDHVAQEIGGVSTTWGTPTVLNVALASTITAVPELPSTAASFEGSFPNPFNPTTTLRFNLSRPASVHLSIHDSQGRRVRALLAGEALSEGPHEILWDGRGDSGFPAPSALYLARLTVEEETQSRKLLLLK